MPKPRDARRALADLGDIGPVPLLLLVALFGVQNFDLVAFGVLAPDIRETFKISSGTITAIAGVTAAVPIVFAVLLGNYGDRSSRVRLSVLAAFVWGATALMCGAAPVLSVLIAARLFGGVGLLSGETIYPSLLSDWYRPERLGSVFGVYRTGGQALALLGGPLAGGIGAVLGWRWAFVILALPTFVLAVAVHRTLREPPRGGSLAIAGEQHGGSILEGYRQIRAIPTLRRTWTSAFLFGGGTIPFLTLLSNFFHDTYHSGDTTRGLLTALYGLGGVVGIVIGAVLAQRATTARRPDRLPTVIGLLIVEFAVGILVMAVAPSFTVAVIAATLLSVGAYGFLPGYTTLVALITPARVRSQAYAWSLFFYALGGIVVSAIIGGIDDAQGVRVGLALLAGICGLGGLIGMSARRFVLADAARALRAEERVDETALLSCRGVDGGYGGIQILFGVDLEVHKGEMIALLGTNGAGKSTLLKAVTGLLDPTGGRITFDGRDITHCDPGSCAEMGIMAVPGGRGIFPTLSVAENLKVAGWQFRKNKTVVAEATDRVYGYFPRLRERQHALAGDLSGGEQQMLSLAQAFIAEPKLLLIDELSLGLAPVVVSQLIDIVKQIHARGTTVVLVEQSVNTALQLADRAVFMEKGEVRFSGPTADLLDRPDVLRAVFLQAPAKGRRARALSNDITLSVEGLSKRYGGVTAVDDVGFELHEGEILGFIGPNGAGKTTMFDLVSGFTRSDSGRVALAGRDITALSAVGRARAGLGRSFQDARLWPALTVAESIAVALHDEAEIEATFPALLGIPKVADSERRIHVAVDELIERMRLGAFRNKFVAELSTGTRRIVELACLLAHRPTVLLLDEPSSGIAQRETEALGPLLRDIREQLGCSMMLIDHDTSLITSVVDRLVALDLGRVIAVGSPGDVLRDPQVMASYLGPDSAPSPATARRAPRKKAAPATLVAAGAGRRTESGVAG